MKRRIFPLLALFIAVLCGCGPLDETRHPWYARAGGMREKGEHAAAAAMLEKLLAKYPGSHRLHGELAVLYNDDLADHFMAVYHFRRFLALAPPDTPDIDAYKGWLEVAEKACLTEWKTRFPELDKEDELESRLTELYQRNRKFRDAIIKLHGRCKAAAKREAEYRLQLDEAEKTVAKLATAPPAAAATPTAERFYLVRKGDTLMGIAREFYGSVKLYDLIFEANRGELPDATSLRPGQKLLIPPPPEPEKTKEN